MRRNRTIRELLTVLVVILFVAGCSGLPTDGPVQSARDVENQENQPRVVQEPEDPEPGADMEDVAEGFLRAHIGVGEGFETAREFLAGDAAQEWDPDQGILVLDTLNLSSRRATGSQIVISARAIGEVDEHGHLTQLPSQQRRQLAMGLEMVDGEWRVTTVPPDLGVWLSRSDFERNFNQRSVYFAAERGPTPTALIPDVRWYPDGGLATSLARAVIGPPPKWLEQTVRRPVPATTRLQPSLVSVSADTGLATVTLSKEALDASPQDRKALWASMIQTLGQVDGVSRVEVRVGNALLQTTGVEDNPTVERLTYSTVSGPQGPVIMRQDNELSWISTLSDRERPNAGRDTSSLADLPLLSKQWDQLAADVDGREIAGISGDRTQLGRWVDTKLTTRPSFGTKLVRPAYDGRRGLWVAGRALGPAGADRSDGDSSAEKGAEKDSAKRAEGPPTIWTVDTRRPVDQVQAEPISTPWLGSREVLSIAVSPEAHRVALVVQDKKGRTSLLLSAVVRDDNGDIDGLAQPIEVNPSVQEAISVTWVDATSLAVIGESSTGRERQPILVPVGGLDSLLGPVSGAETVVGSHLPQDRLFVVTDRHTIVHRLGQAWEEFDSARDLLAPPSS